MSPIVGYFADYESYHQTHGNEVCHKIGIPLIVFSVLGLLAKIHVSGTRLDAGLLIWVLSSIWYLRLDVKLGSGLAVTNLALWYFAREISLPWLWGLFALGWVFQFVGHGKYEKKSPAFLKNISHLLIGPLWVFSKMTHILPAQHRE